MEPFHFRTCRYPYSDAKRSSLPSGTQDYTPTREGLAGNNPIYFEYYPGVKEWRIPLFTETSHMIHVMKMYADQNVGNGYSKSWSQWKKETFGQ